MAVNAGAGMVAVLFAVMASMTWLCWPDVLIDFGEELYVPWQMLSGKVLYRDISHLFGPISSYFNMALFSVFGVSFKTIYIANLALFGLFLVLLYRWLGRATSRANAVIVTGMVISIFGFAQYIPAGNYNFISPYRHTAAHGLFLSLLLLMWLSLWHEKRNSCLRAAIAGACFGCTLLTRAEIGVAAAAMAGASLLIMAVRPDGTKTLRPGLFFALATCLPLVIFFVLFSFQMPLKDAMKAVANLWIVLLATDASQGEFYKWGMGIDAPLRNGLTTVGSATVVAVGLAALSIGSHYAGSRKASPAKRMLSFLAVAGIVALAALVTPYNAARGFPVLCLAALIMLAWRWWKAGRTQIVEQQGEIPLLLLSVFSLALLAKMLLFCRIYHYGFYLTLPASILVWSMAFWFIPRSYETNMAGRRIYQTALILFLGIFCARCITITKNFSDSKTLRVGQGADAILTYGPDLDSRGYFVAEAIDWIQNNTKPGSTLTVLPEGSAINYWTRRASSVPFTNFMPAELMGFGEENILVAFQADPPDYVLLVHKDMSEFGLGNFGQDPRCGAAIMGWIREQYRPAWRIGDEPLAGEGFGMLLLEKMPLKTD